MQAKLTNLRTQFRQEHRWVQLALWAWIVLAVALCVKILVQGDRHSVYPAFAGGSQDWWAGEVMYDHYGYYYSPTFSVLFSPFGLLPDRLGQTLWGLTSIGLFVWSLRAFYRDVLPQHWPREMEAGFLLLTLGGALRGIWSLQSNAVIMACILFAAAAIVRSGWWRAAWLLAVPIYIKVWPAVAAGLLGVQWPRKLIGRGIVCCAALACVPFLTKAPGEVVGYYRAWVECLETRQATVQRFTGYRDGWTIWEQFQSPVNAHAYFIAQAVGGLATLAFCLWLGRTRKTEGRSQKAEIITYSLAAWSMWQLLLGPGTERLTYLIVAPFAAWAVMTSYFERRNFPLAAAAFVTTFVLGAGGVERILIRWIPVAPALQPIGVIMFGLWLVRHAASSAAWRSSEIAVDSAARTSPQLAVRAAA
jgi:alpha-1,2-mannosyltransferase